MLTKSRYIFIIISIVIVFSNESTAQSKIDSTMKSIKIAVLPLVFYTPDTRWGFGCGGFVNIHFAPGQKTNKLSTIVFGASYTQNKQLLLYVPYQLYFDHSRYWFNGEISYFKYIYNYFGIGNNTEDDYLEKYTVNFPRFRINALKKISVHDYIGVKYHFDNFTYKKYDTLQTQLFNKSILGTENGIVSSLGLIYTSDHRDVLNYPSHGYLAELSVITDDKLWASDYNFTKISFDASTYHKLSKKIILANNINYIQNVGATPFHQMATIGGTRKLRGYFDGKFRDRAALVLQSELRIKIWRKFKMACFGGIGQVFNDPSKFNFQYIRSNIGIGMRYELDKSSRMHLRIDYGITKSSSGYYLTFGEAF